MWNSFFPNGGRLPPSWTRVELLYWKMRLPPCHFVSLTTPTQHRKKRFTLLVGLIDSDYDIEFQFFLWEQRGISMGHMEEAAVPFSIFYQEVKINDRISKNKNGRPFEDSLSPE